jgi:hypothetical protein
MHMLSERKLRRRRLCHHQVIGVPDVRFAGRASVTDNNIGMRGYNNALSAFWTVNFEIEHGVKTSQSVLYMRI